MVRPRARYAASAAAVSSLLFRAVRPVCEAGPAEKPVNNSIFQYNLVDIDGNNVSQETLKEKAAILIVNVACE